MTVRHFAILLSIVAISLFAFNAYNKPSEAAAVCVDGSYAPSKIISACTELIESSDATPSQMVSYLNYRSWAFKRDGDLEAAISDLDSILEIEPAYLNAWINKAYYHDDLGDIGAAAEDFAAALALEPNNTSTLMRRAKMSYLRGDYELAQQDYEQVLQLDPSHSRAIVNLIATHIEQGNSNTAIELLNQTILTWPDSPLVFRTLGKLYFYSNDYERSLQAFSKLIELKPDTELSLLGSAMVHFRSGDEGAGNEYIDRFAEQASQRPDSIRSWLTESAFTANTMTLFFRGSAFSMIGQRDLARAELDRFLIEGGDKATEVLQRILAGSEIDNAAPSSIDDDRVFDKVLDRYIQYLEFYMSQKDLANQVFGRIL